MTDRKELERANQELTESISTAYDTIEAAISMTDYLDTLTSVSPEDKILELTGERVREIFPFRATAFYLFNNDTGELEVKRCRPGGEAGQIEELIADEIEKGNVHIALRDQRPMLRHLEDNEETRLLMHAICTSRRCRGLFVGLYHPGERSSDRLSLLLLTLILAHCANALESAALYGLVQSSNRHLTGIVERNRLQFEKINRGVDRIFRLIQFMMRRDPAVSLPESATRITVIRAVYGSLTQSGTPQEADVPEMISILAGHYLTTFSLDPGTVAVETTEIRAHLSIDTAIALAVAVYELLAWIFHRNPSGKNQERVVLAVRQDTETGELVLEVQDASGLPYPDSDEARMLTFLARDEMQGRLITDTSEPPRISGIRVPPA